jgi:NADH dehydrogenase/NADH:ubiquinone oxidoreductase subunit G
MNPAPCLQIHINGQPLLVDKGQTILQAARAHGIEIPTLCDFPGLPPHGSCRLCIVELQGRANTPTACTTPVEAGMVIHTHSPRVMALRKELIQMLLADHPAGCLFCPEKGHCDECMVTLRKAGVTTGCGSCAKDGQCELQTLAEQYEVTSPQYPMRYRMLPVEKHDPFFDRDPNLCILCGRCIRVCEDLHFDSTLTYTSRGAQALVSTPFHRLHLDTSCAFCGSCVEVCPTGALSEKTRKWAGKPEHETPSTCALCSAGCQIRLLTRGERVLGSLPNRQAGSEVLCVKGRFAITELVQPVTRPKQPLLAGEHGRQPVSWDEAGQRMAEKLAACPPERFELRISAACTLEDLFVARQFASQVMHSQARLAEAAQYGSALPAVANFLGTASTKAPAPTYEALPDASAILCLGLDDRYAHTPLAVHLKRAQQHGAKLILLGPHHPTWSGHADLCLPCAPGEETTLIQQLAANKNSAAIQDGAAIDMSGSVILLGPAALASLALLQAVETLRQAQDARVIALPAEANLAGALRLGLGAAPASGDLDVLLLFGAPIPDDLPGQPWIASHGLLPPASESGTQLCLPASAFSEEHGTLIDYAGRARTLRPAVAPPGEAQPVWQVLTRLAHQLGAPGFDYTCVEDIWQAAQTEFPGFPALPTAEEQPWPAAGMDGSTENLPAPAARTALQPAYLGIALTQRVAGLRSLYPGHLNGRADESHS